MFDLERLSFSEIRDAYPDRFQKVDLAASRIECLDGPQFAVERNDSDEGHAVELVETLSHYWGTCTCDGFGWNDGPCSHLCALKRADAKGLISIPTGEPEAISVEVRDRQQEIADHAAEPDIAADGGIHR